MGHRIYFVVSKLYAPFAIFTTVPTFNVSSKADIRLISRRITNSLVDYFMRNFLVQGNDRFFYLFFISRTAKGGILFRYFGRMFKCLCGQGSQGTFDLWLEPSTVSRVLSFVVYTCSVYTCSTTNQFTV